MKPKGISEQEYLLSERLLQKNIYRAGDSEPFFDRLGKSYPMAGSKIDWTKVNGSVERSENDRRKENSAFRDFFIEILNSENLRGDAIYVGDSLTDSAFCGDVVDFESALMEILEIPQHHYFFSRDLSWCLSLTMEGDMAFGRRQESY